jgi:hypothetical protein
LKKTSRFWFWTAVVYTAINAGGAVIAAIGREWMHAGLHVALLGVGYVAWQFVPRKRDDVEQAAAPELSGPEVRIDSIQDAVDSIALNVERIGEAQRFQEKLVKERLARESKSPDSKE